MGVKRPEITFLILGVALVGMSYQDHPHYDGVDSAEVEEIADPEYEISERRLIGATRPLQRFRHNGAGGPITFPHELISPRFPNGSNTLAHIRRQKAVPLKFLRGLSTERDVSRIFEKYVTNVKLQDVNGQKYVVDLRGDPIDAGLGGPVIISDTEIPQLPDKQKTSKFGGFSNRNIPKPPAFTAAERVGVTSRVSKPAICEPELRTVEVPSPNDPNVIQFPRCVRLERCGGCCGSDLLTCEPIRSKQTDVQVSKFVYNDETEKLEFKESLVLTLPSHVECRCNCKIKASDCSARHVYSSEDCLCSCKNRGEQELCLKIPHKLWDASLCQCVCREIKVCSSGFIFNIENCECERNPEGRRTDFEQSPKRNRREHIRIRTPRET